MNYPNRHGARSLVPVAVLLALSMSGCTFDVAGPVAPPPDSWDPALNTHPAGTAFQELLDAYVCEGIPGVVLLVRTPQGVWNGASGYANIEAGIPMLPTHRHHAASVTKMYTAAAAMLLVERGQIELDSRITEYLPPEVYERVPNGAESTVRQLLGHTSGIPDFSGDLAYDLDFLNDPLGSFPPERLLSYLQGQSAWSAPGTHYFYSNANYYLLALLMDHVVEGGHAGVISDGIIRRLGLNATYYKNEPGYPAPDGLVNSYQDLAGEGRLVNVSDMTIHAAELFAGNAGLIATSADYAKFVEALLDGRVIGQQSLDSMLRPTVYEGYGLGLSILDTPYGPGIGHDGRDFGIMSQVRYFPDVAATLVLLENAGDAGIAERLFQRLWDEAMRAALGSL